MNLSIYLEIIVIIRAGPLIILIVTAASKFLDFQDCLSSKSNWIVAYYGIWPKLK